MQKEYLGPTEFPEIAANAIGLLFRLISGINISAEKRAV
jgi:hypothetical protein